MDDTRARVLGESELQVGVDEQKLSSLRGSLTQPTLVGVPLDNLMDVRESVWLVVDFYNLKEYLCT